MAKKSATAKKEKRVPTDYKTSAKTVHDLIESAMLCDARIYSEDWTPRPELTFHLDPDHLMRLVNGAYIKSIGSLPADLESSLAEFDDLDDCPVEFDTETFHAKEIVKARYELNEFLPQIKIAPECVEDLESAFSRAIVLGMKLQAYFDYLEVQRGESNGRAVATASASRISGKKARSAIAKAEFDQRMVGETRKAKRTQTLKIMANVMDENGKPKYGSYPTLERYYKEWTTLKSSE